MSDDRRSFLKKAAAALAGTSLVPTGSTAQQPRAPSARALDSALLSALAETVLPSALGTAGIATAANAFVHWIGAYKPVSEAMHGYGDAEITYTPADPAPGWQAQLQALDLLARQKHRRGFAALDRTRREALVRGQFARVRTSALPGDPLTAPHVAVALLAHWADSSAASDLVYGAAIAKGNCRGLADVTRLPLPLHPGSR